MKKLFGGFAIIALMLVIFISSSYSIAADRGGDPLSITSTAL